MSTPVHSSSAPSSPACLARETLASLLRGELDADQEQSATLHLDACPRCQTRLEQVAAAPDFAQQLGQRLQSAQLAAPRPHATPAYSSRSPASAPADNSRSLLDSRADAPILPPQPLPKTGDLLGRYRIEREIGRGGMGIVFEAEDVSLHRPVALKVLAPQWAADRLARQRFLSEARAAAAISSPYVVTVYAVEELEGWPILVMEFVRGRSLQELLDEKGPLPLDQIAAIGWRVAAGLAAAHRRGLVHRDVKPANILIENTTRKVKLTDFGLARAADDARLTRDGVIVGTPAYMSPEQVFEGDVDHRSDLFSFGSVLFSMALGEPPFTHANTLAIVRAVVETQPIRARQRDARLPEWFDQLVARLHAKSPADRFQSADEVARLLKHGLPEGAIVATGVSEEDLPPPEPPLPPPPPNPARSSRPQTSEIQPPPIVVPAGVVASHIAPEVSTSPVDEPTEAMPLVTTTLVTMPKPRGAAARRPDKKPFQLTAWNQIALTLTGFFATLAVILLVVNEYVASKPPSSSSPTSFDGRSLSTASGFVQPLVNATPLPQTDAAIEVWTPGKAVRPFEDLERALVEAENQSTVLVKADHEYRLRPLNLQGKSLAIRGASGNKPKIVLDVPSDGVAAIVADCTLELEGLELRAVWSSAPRGMPRAPAALLDYFGPDLRVRRCRLSVAGGTSCLTLHAPNVGNCELEFSEFHGGEQIAVWWQDPAGGPHDHAQHRLFASHCVFTGRAGLLLESHDGASFQSQWVRSTFRTRETFRFEWPRAAALGSSSPSQQFGVSPGGPLAPTQPASANPAAGPLAGPGPGPRRQVFTLEGNVLDAEWVVSFWSRQAEDLPQRAEATRRLPQVIDWHGRNNQYSEAAKFLGVGGWNVARAIVPRDAPESLTEWLSFWGSREFESVQAPIRYRQGQTPTAMHDAQTEPPQAAMYENEQTVNQPPRGR